MASADYDLQFLKAGIDQLESYLLSNDIYRPIGIKATAGEKPYPQLTLGWLLLSRLKALATSSSDQKRELDRLIEHLETIRTRWRAAWSAKAKSEFHARLNLWRDFLEDYRKHPRENTDRYAYEINRRVLLQLLQIEADNLPQTDLDMLDGLDRLLRSAFQPGDFIWEAVLMSGFPEQIYWYLYGKLKQR
jgi:hypothetical protein